MTNPTPQDREMAEQFRRGIGGKYDRDVSDITQAITTARLQGRKEGLEEAARACRAHQYSPAPYTDIMAAIRKLGEV